MINFKHVPVRVEKVMMTVLGYLYLIFDYTNQNSKKKNLNLEIRVQGENMNTVNRAGFK